jgi:NAD(P)-dependent dehydrogenase (short-subunit alcohol dehydrogenase family)
MTGRTVLVTGASSGIGRETAILLSQLGARVIAQGRDAGRLDETMSKLVGKGHLQSLFDLCDIDAVPAWVQKCTAESGGRLHGMVHSAGISLPQPIRTWDLAVHEKLVRINLTAAFALVKGARHAKVRGQGASIVLISSISGLSATSALSDYGATKGGIISMTKALALELAREGVRVNCVSPGLIQDVGMALTEGHVDQETLAKVHENNPLGPGYGLDVAHAIVFLLSPAARWINGVCLPVDGGASI